MKKLLGSVLDFGAFFGLCWVFARHGQLVSTTHSLLVFLIVAYAITTIIVDSHIAQPLSLLAGKIPFIGKGIYSETRDKDGDLESTDGLLSCSLCTGMWVGALLAWVGVSAFPTVSVVDYVAHGAMASGVSYFVSKIAHRLG